MNQTKQPEKFESTAEAMKAGALKPILTPSLRAGIATQLLAAEIMNQGMHHVGSAECDALERAQERTDDPDEELPPKGPVALALLLAEALAKQAGYAVPG